MSGRLPCPPALVRHREWRSGAERDHSHKTMYARQHCKGQDRDTELRSPLRRQRLPVTSIAHRFPDPSTIPLSYPTLPTFDNHPFSHLTHPHPPPANPFSQHALHPSSPCYRRGGVSTPPLPHLASPRSTPPSAPSFSCSLYICGFNLTPTFLRPLTTRKRKRRKGV